MVTRLGMTKMTFMCCSFVNDAGADAVVGCVVDDLYKRESTNWNRERFLQKWCNFNLNCNSKPFKWFHILLFLLHLFICLPGTLNFFVKVDKFQLKSQVVQWHLQMQQQPVFAFVYFIFFLVLSYPWTALQSPSLLFFSWLSGMAKTPNFEEKNLISYCVIKDDFKFFANEKFNGV